MSTPFLIFFWHFLNLFHPKAGFWEVKAAFFLDIAGKMQCLGLLRLIEKFAEIHRQVSLRSLTTISWRAFVCFSRLNPFQLQNAPHSALKLHLPFLKWGYVGLPPKPTWGFTPNPSKELRSLHPLSASRDWTRVSNKKAREIESLRLSSFFYGYHSILFETEIISS